MGASIRQESTTKARGERGREAVTVISLCERHCMIDSSMYDNDMSTMLNASATPPPARAQETARWLALGAIAGPVLFTLAWIVLGPLRPGYTSVSEQMSALA